MTTCYINICNGNSGYPPEYERCSSIKAAENYFRSVAEDVAPPTPDVGDVILQASVTYLSDLTWTALSLEEAP